MSGPLPISNVYDPMGGGNYYNHYFGVAGEQAQTADSRAQYNKDLSRFVGLMPGTPFDPHSNTETRAYQYPKAFEGQSVFLGKFVAGLLASQDSSFILSEADGLPVVYTDQMRFNWKSVTFSRALMDPEPEEGVARIMRSKESADGATLLRWGIAAYMEHGFMYTDAGRQHFFMQLKAMENAIRNTYEMATLAQIMTVRSKVFDYEIKNQMRFTAKDRITLIEDRNAEFIRAQKSSRGLDQAVLDGKHHLKLRGVNPTTIWCPAKGEIFFRGVGNEKLKYSEVGPSGPALANRDPYTMVATFHEVRLRVLQDYKTDAPSGLPINPFQTYRTFGQFWRMFGRKIGNINLEDYRSSHRDIRVYNFERDQFEWLTLSDCLENCVEFANEDQMPGDQFPEGTKPLEGLDGEIADLFGTYRRTAAGERYTWAKTLGMVGRKILPYEVIEAMAKQVHAKGLGGHLLQFVEPGYGNGIFNVGVSWRDFIRRGFVEIGGAPVPGILDDSDQWLVATREGMARRAAAGTSAVAGVDDIGLTSMKKLSLDPKIVNKMHDENNALLLSLDQATSSTYTSVAKAVKTMEKDKLPAFISTTHQLVHDAGNRATGIAKLDEMWKTVPEKAPDAFRDRLSAYIGEHASRSAPTASAPMDPVPATQDMAPIKVGVYTAAQINGLIASGQDVSFLNRSLEPCAYRPDLALRPESSIVDAMLMKGLAGGIEIGEEDAPSQAAPQTFRGKKLYDPVKHPDQLAAFEALLAGGKYADESFEEMEYNYTRAKTRPVTDELVPIIRSLIVCKITKKFLRWLIENHIIFPFGNIVFRPWMQAITSTAILAGMGRQLGFFAIGKSDVMFADDANIKAHRLHYTGYSYPIIYKPEAIWYMDDLWMSDFHSGHNLEFFDEDTIEEKKTSRFVAPNPHDHEDYSQQPSIFCCMTAYRDDYLRNTVDLRGVFPGDDPKFIRRHFLATRAFVDKWNFKAVDEDPHPNDPDTTAPNLVCSQALQFVYNHVTDSHASVLPVTDCMGPNIFDGCMRLIRQKAGFNNCVLEDCKYHSLGNEY